MQIEPLGDSALLIRVAEIFDAEKSLNHVLRATRQLEVAQIPGVIDLAPAYLTIGVFYDPAQIGTLDEFRTSIENALRSDLDSAPSRAVATIEVPVCYDNEFGPD